MKIAYVLNTYPQPSHSFIRRELQALERLGLNVTRLAMRRPDLPLVDDRDRQEEAATEFVLERGAMALTGALLGRVLADPRRGLRALRLALRCGAASPLGRLRHLIYLAEAGWVAGRCKRDGIAHLHAHFGTNSAMVAMLANALGGPRYSFTVHGPEEFDAPAALSLPAKLERAAFAVGVSQFGRSQLCRWTAFEAWNRLAVVPCGIEPGAFEQAAPLPEGALHLVSIGRFAEQKGQMVLVQAMARLRDTHPDLHLTLVGDGPMRPVLAAEIDKAGLEGRITLTGWLDQDGVRAALDASHALVMPSFAEGLPMVVMEAMAAARPVISTYVAGIPELVQPGRTGWLVPAGDDGALADAIRTLAVTPREQLAAMGAVGRTRALRRHDIDRAAARLAALMTRTP
ncbi:Glycosyltransferase involved in cell wall bisynthesis [Cribrihabitans marinus]|uniref:Glycosyltransferase involved in cell wall bisynthesis n=1 Tax=Cribrihabitans marinus TaxID=1227549 RepID=A0A1H6SLK0_9RHOB|nr:glycosyltransferase [Cribrihabitans marinus]GGH23180.1 colanic acid biosynthesis glycosyltransferase WcaL [Cribrihabitans marinus]SEI68769.1 Glycosyltransferase involved in cell wall bisynthesis [Cribrihabitans marinus]